MFGNQTQSPTESLLRMLKFTAAIMVFSGVVRLIQADGLPDIGVYINTPDFMLLLFGGCAYLAAFLIEQRNNLSYIPITIATLYPLSVSLTTGQGLNIVIILFGAFILYRIWRLHQDGYFGTR